MLVHLAAIDFETLTELEIGISYQFFKMRLAFYQWHLPQILTVEIKQVESDQDYFGGCALQFVLENRKISCPVGGRHNDLAVDDRRPRTNMPRVIRDFFEALSPIMAATGEYLHGGSGMMGELCQNAPIHKLRIIT